MLMACLAFYVIITTIGLFGHKLSYQGQFVSVTLVVLTILGALVLMGYPDAALYSLFVVIGFGFLWFIDSGSSGGFGYGGGDSDDGGGGGGGSSGFDSGD